MGMNITNVPVINPDFVAVVYWRPTVCVANPMKNNTPKNNPALTKSMSECSKGLKRNGRSNNAASENLIPINSIGEISLRASLMMANVTPQKIVIEKRALSPIYFFMRNRLNN